MGVMACMHGRMAHLRRLLPTQEPVDRHAEFSSEDHQSIAAWRFAALLPAPHRNCGDLQSATESGLGNAGLLPSAADASAQC